MHNTEKKLLMLLIALLLSCAALAEELPQSLLNRNFRAFTSANTSDVVVFDSGSSFDYIINDFSMGVSTEEVEHVELTDIRQISGQIYSCRVAASECIYYPEGETLRIAMPGVEESELRDQGSVQAIWEDVFDEDYDENRRYFYPGYLYIGRFYKDGRCVFDAFFDDGEAVGTVAENGVSAGGTVIGAGGKSNLRDGPGLDYSKVEGVVIHEGERAEYTGQTSVDDRGVAWYSVRFLGCEGWVSSRYTRLEGGSNADTAPVQPMIEFETETDTSGTAIEFETETAATGTVIGGRGKSNLRTGPGLDYSKIEGVVIHEGERAEYTGQTSVDDRGVAWYSVRFKGHEGWVSSRYTVFDGSGSSAAQPDGKDLITYMDRDPYDIASLFGVSVTTGKLPGSDGEGYYPTYVIKGKGFELDASQWQGYIERVLVHDVRSEYTVYGMYVGMSAEDAFSRMQSLGLNPQREKRGYWCYLTSKYLAVEYEDGLVTEVCYYYGA